MDTLQINKANAIKAYNAADENGKVLLVALFGNDILTPQKITDRVKSFEDACNVLGIEPDDEVPYTDPTEPDRIAVNAFAKLIVITRALNEGWTPNWNKSNQYKWYPWFYMDDPGFRFSGADYATDTYSTGGSRLCFSSEELAKYAAKQFLDVYKEMMT